MRRGNRIQAASDQAHAHRLRAGLSEALPWLAVGANLELARLALAQSDAAGARILLVEADLVLSRFPSFGRLARDVGLLRGQANASAAVVVGATALTAAELRLLPYLSTYLSFREIGERVGVSANTIKSQTMSIYRKLDVSSRGDAIARAAAVGLTDPLRDPGFRLEGASDAGGDQTVSPGAGRPGRRHPHVMMPGAEAGGLMSSCDGTRRICERVEWCVRTRRSSFDCR